MATTSPDNIWTPDSGDQYALTQDLGANADSVQAALIRRGNLYIGTAAQRTAFTAAPTGVNWQDTDGTQAKYVRTTSGWLMLGEKFYSGTSAQRPAFTSAPNGAQWQDTDGEKLLWRRDESTWVLVNPTPPWVEVTALTGGWTAAPGTKVAWREREGRLEFSGNILRASGVGDFSTMFTIPSEVAARYGTFATPFYVFNGQAAVEHSLSQLGAIKGYASGALTGRGLSLSTLSVAPLA